MNLKHEQLKVNIKSLTAESVIIRKREQEILSAARKLSGNLEATQAKYPAKNLSEELKQMYEVYANLRNHRASRSTGVSWLRTGTRISLLAYGYLRGKQRSQLESPKKETGMSFVDPKILMEKINRFSPYDKQIKDVSIIQNWLGS